MTAGNAVPRGGSGGGEESPQQALARAILEYKTARKKWVKKAKVRRGAEPVRPVRRGRDLSGISLNGLDLKGWDLSGSHGTNIGLASANLRGANLRGVRWVGVTLVGANLQDIETSTDTLLQDIRTDGFATPWGGGQQVTGCVMFGKEQVPFAQLRSRLGVLVMALAEPDAAATAARARLPAEPAPSNGSAGGTVASEQPPAAEA